MVREEGHEAAFHGWTHEPLWKLTSERFREEVKAFKKLHSDCIGFRAPSFSLNNKTKWVLKILQEEGFKYDSSIFPVRTPLYGTYKAPTHPYHPSLANITEENGNCSIMEFPLAVYKLFGLKVPTVIYIHNWELDEETPKVNAGILGRFQAYHNLDKAKQKLVSLLSEFNFTNFATYIKDMQNSWA